MEAIPPASDTKPEAPNSAPRPNYTIAVLCHLLGLTLFLGIPLVNIIAPLVLWLLTRNNDPFVDRCGKEAVNFQLSISLYLVLAGVLIFAFVGVILLPALMIFHIIVTLVAAFQASEGNAYRYPLTLRFLR
ncbi:MAG: DUF4870 domain-containing protein [Opitutales bacterium]|jgi:uncharacterized Tic20 family protein